ncbi:substrate-binding domain-containing protein [Saccharopolyspora sp. TS4A08]|uniref:Substrate-binding domain-containing protein n=1 Tax=Saccharopolyspora ipomoeae TaxID=3042027 RepID=A0ABT6PR82_9PSEU|nr:substrate-binding domain-containing protein [Saccharopolyspora sp. TS4A08]MDI2030173.1 substrate-binding domain-containing protein [Saccharopolyspora sp. TS4A08]
MSGTDGDIMPFCPKQPMKVGYAKGTSNTWTKITLAEIKAEASKCPTITDVVFTDAQGNQQKAISDLNGLVAQGVKAIVVQPEFGAAQLPSMRAAMRAGVAIVPLISNPGGTQGTDYQDFAFEDTKHVGAVQAEWLAKTVGKGKVVFLGGSPGAASSQQFFSGLKEALRKYPDLQLVSDQVVDTNWDTGQKKRVMAGLLAQHGRIEAVVSDYGLTDTGVLDAYAEANLPMPALATNASGNINGCQWEKGNFPFLSLDGTTSIGRIALRKAVAVAGGSADPEPGWVNIPVVVDTVNGKPPKCDPSLPPDVDLSSSLPLEQLRAAAQ